MEVISMANKGNVLRKMVNENLGLVLLIILLSLYLVGRAVVIYFQIDDVELEVIVILLVFVFGGGCGFTALCEAVFRRKY